MHRAMILTARVRPAACRGDTLQSLNPASGGMKDVRSRQKTAGSNSHGKLRSATLRAHLTGLQRQRQLLTGLISEVETKSEVRSEDLQSYQGELRKIAGNLGKLRRIKAQYFIYPDSSLKS